MSGRRLQTLALVISMMWINGAFADAWPPVITDPQPMDPNAVSDSNWDYSPQVATDTHGTWLAVWATGDPESMPDDGEILFTRSTDAGESWSDVAFLNTTAETDTAMNEEPFIATDRSGNWVAVWTSDNDLDGTIGTEYDILCARSADDGATWTDPEALNGNAGTDIGIDQEPRLVTDGSGVWVAIWSSTDDLEGTIGNDGDILYARSQDNGVTWSYPAPLNTDAVTDTAHDGLSQFATDGPGTWIAVWMREHYEPGSTSVLYSRSTDDGASWSAPQRLSREPADMAYDLYPHIGADRLGRWVVVWTSNDDLGGTIGTDDDILFSRSTDQGLSWSAPAPLNTDAATEWDYDDEPYVATDRCCNWVAVWSRRADPPSIENDLLISRSVDNGATWSQPESLNTNAATDSGSDNDPMVATDGLGNWIALWTSEDDLEGTIDTDPDTLIARFQLAAMAIPTVSTIGVIAMGVVILIAGVVVIRRRRSVCTTG